MKSVSSESTTITITGPPKSGKTTTLAGMIKAVQALAHQRQLEVTFTENTGHDLSKRVAQYDELVSA